MLMGLSNKEDSETHSWSNILFAIKKKKSSFKLKKAGLLLIKQDKIKLYSGHGVS